MTRHGRHFDQFQPHTRLKHTILDAYIVAWAMKLLLWRGAGDRLAIVDAFAGAGRDSEGNEGSPLIAVKRARQAMAEASTHPGLENARVHVFAIEADARRFQQLEQNLVPFARETPDLVHVLRGELVDHINGIRDHVGDCPAFYFLDPFGIKGLDATTYPKALSGRHNEVFALFADMGAVRLHGLVSAGQPSAASEIERILAAPSLFPEYDAAEIEAVQEQVARAKEALDASIPASREHLTRALGGPSWLSQLERTAPQDRANTFLRLFCEALIQAGARHVLTIPMRNDLGQRVYALVHATKSTQGLVTMKECVSTGLRRAELSPEARAAMMADLSVDSAALVRALRRQLAGKTVSWADEQHGLRQILLAHTALFHFQADEIKASLKAAGVLRRVNRREVCVFPAVK